MEVYLTPDKGWGVRAAAYIPRGTFIVEYAGEVRLGSDGAGAFAWCKHVPCPWRRSVYGQAACCVCGGADVPAARRLRRWWTTRSAAGAQRRPRPAASRTFT